MSESRAIKVFFIFLACVFSLSAYGQKTKTQLEYEKRENLRRIAEAEKILSDTETERKTTLGQLTALNEQIKARESLIGSINQEIELLNGEISDLSIIVNALHHDLKKLKEEYAAMIYSSYKANRGYNKITFLFSASTFNQLFMRLKYLEQYAEARRVQATQIQEVSEELDDQRSQVEIKRTEQRTLLDQQLTENRKLVQLKVKQNSLISELTKKEKELRGELAERKEAVARLDNLIADIVRKELERSKTLSATALASEEETSAFFESNKTRLEWPVNTGFISQKFGKHPHPVLKGIIEDNPGVNIQTSPNASVKSVFNGRVVTRAFVPGMNNVVIIQHGDYYTLYAKLKEVGVSKGQVVSANEVIGRVYTDKSGLSELHFEVWKKNIKLNPEQWLSIR